MTAKLDYIWKLREVMATRGLFQTTHLRPRLAERGIHLSDSQVYRLVTDKPERLNLKVLMALLDILGCRMDDLIQPVAVPAAKTKKKTAGQGSDAGARNRRVPAQAGADRSRFPAVTGRVPAGGSGFRSEPGAVIAAIVAGAEPGLGQAGIAAAVAQVAPSRAQQRRLADALTGDPGLLTTGHPGGPAPDRVADQSPAGARCPAAGPAVLRALRPAQAARPVRRQPADLLSV